MIYLGTMPGGTLIHRNQLLDAVKSVDGSGSGIDADLIDGYNVGYDGIPLIKGYDNTGVFDLYSGDLDSIAVNSTYNTSDTATHTPPGVDANGYVTTYLSAGYTASTSMWRTQSWIAMEDNTLFLRYSNAAGTWSTWTEVISTDNLLDNIKNVDGSTSGIDAQYVDGFSVSEAGIPIIKGYKNDGKLEVYTNNLNSIIANSTYSTNSSTANVPSGNTSDGLGYVTTYIPNGFVNNSTMWRTQIWHSMKKDEMFMRHSNVSNSWGAWVAMISSVNLKASILAIDGTGSGIDADKLDGKDSEDFLSIPADVLSLTNGQDHTFIITTSNDVYVTGGTDDVGAGVTPLKYFTKIPDIKAKTISTSYGHSMLIGMDDYIYSTGGNDSGQLGLGDTTARNGFTKTNLQAKQITITGDMSYAIGLDDYVYTCGSNYFGGLGLGDNTDRNVFTKTNIQAKNFAFPTTTWATGVITLDDSLYVTGYNDSGQLGLGDNTNRNVFTDTGYDCIEAIISDYNSVLVTTTNDVYITGINNHGQCETGDTTAINTWRKVSKAGKHVGLQPAYRLWVVGTDDYVYGCGSNFGGSLGINNTADEDIFSLTTTGITGKEIINDKNHTIVKGLDNFYYIVLSNEHTFTLLSNKVKDVRAARNAYIYTGIGIADNKAYVHGYSTTGQLGLGDTTLENSFTKIDYIDLNSPYPANKILATNGSGDVTLASNQDLIDRVKTVDGAGSELDADKLDGKEGSEYALKNGNVANTFSAKDAVASSDVVTKSQLEAVTGTKDIDETNISNGKILQFDSTTDKYKLVDAKPTLTFMSKSGSNSQLFLINGKVYQANGTTTYYNAYTTGVYNNGANTSYGVYNMNNINIPSSSPVKKIVGGYYQYVGLLTEDGSLFTFGYNGSGQCGLGHITATISPVLASTGVLDVYDHPSQGEYPVTHNRLFILKSDGLYATGYNHTGQCGIDDVVNLNVFTKCTGLTNTVHTDIKKVFPIGCEFGFTFVLTSNNKLWVTGQNGNGSHGDGTVADKSTFTDVTSHWVTTGKTLSDIKVSGGDRYFNTADSSYKDAVVILLKYTDGTSEVKTSGFNQWGQLGNGTTTSSNTPQSPINVPTDGTIIDIAGIGSGGLAVQALSSSGDLYAWGYNSKGQVGDGTTTSRATPMKIETGVTKIFSDGMTSNLYGYNTQSFIQKADGFYMSGYDDGSDYSGMGVEVVSNVTTHAKVKLPADDNQVVEFGHFTTTTHGRILVAYTKKGNLYVWGYNGQSGISDNTTHCVPIPQLVPLPISNKETRWYI